MDRVRKLDISERNLFSSDSNMKHTINFEVMLLKYSKEEKFSLEL
jgi:hypothetical protein